MNQNIRLFIVYRRKNWLVDIKMDKRKNKKKKENEEKSDNYIERGHDRRPL